MQLAIYLSSKSPLTNFCAFDYPLYGRPTEDAGVTETASGAVIFDTKLVPLSEMTEMASLAYNTFSNSTKSKEVEKTLWKLKEGLKAWAAWQAKQLIHSIST